MASGVLVDVEVFVNATYGYDIRGEIVGERGTVALAESGGAVV
jgi:myo-inositol 2-dehydrogenase / D-chiro-inositol 1-dehydrogenase